MAREGVTVAADGTIPGVRWLIDHDRQLKITLAECSGCRTGAARPPHRPRRAAQPPMGNICPNTASMRSTRSTSTKAGPGRRTRGISSYGVPWLKDDINATLKTMTAEQVSHVDGEAFLGTFVRFNASPWFTTRIADLISMRKTGGISTRPRPIATAT